MTSNKGSMLAEAVAACFVAVTASFCIAAGIRCGVMIFTSAKENLEIERARRSVISTLYSGNIPASSDYKNVRVVFEGLSSDDKLVVIRIEKDGFLKVRRSYVVWPKEEWQQ